MNTRGRRPTPRAHVPADLGSLLALLNGSQVWSADRVGEGQGAHATATGAAAADQEAARAHRRAEYINVPGAFWQGRMSTVEKETLYKCVVREHSDRSRLPSDAHGVGIYSSHWNDNNGFTWQGNATLIAQDDALRAAVA